MTIKKIISGGQTGIDRGTLSACLDHNFLCGGYCPQGRLAEDGIIPDRYPLIELPNQNYLSRTIKNIQASDGTVIIYFDYVEGGTEKTLLHCIQESKPYKLIDATHICSDVSSKLIIEFCDRHQVNILNIAGPRASKCPLSFDYSYQSIAKVIKTIGVITPN